MRYYRRSRGEGNIAPSLEGGITRSCSNCSRPIAIYFCNDAVRKLESSRSNKSRCGVIFGYQNITRCSGILQAVTVPY